MKSIKYLVGVFLLVAAVGCEYNEDALPVNIDKVVNNNGAYLRLIQVQTQGIDILNFTADSSVYRVIGEIYDAKEGDFVTGVDFYVRRSGASAARTIAETATPFKTVPRSAFARGHGAFGDFPRATINVTVGEVLAALGITTADIQIGDVYNLRWVVKLSNGKSFTSTDVNPAITGAFFNSPYAASCNVVSSVDPNTFVGSYTFTQQAPATNGIYGAFNSGATAASSHWLFNNSQTWTVTLSVDPNNPFDGRVFTATSSTLAGFVASAVVWRMRLAVAAAKPQNRARLLQQQNFITSTGGTLACAGAPAIAFGPETINVSNFDQDNDASFVFVVRENSALSCGFPAAHVAFTVTKN